MGCLKKGLIILAVVVGVSTLLWFLLLGGGVEPLSLVAQPQRDLVVAVERPVTLFFESVELLEKAGWIESEESGELPPRWVLNMMDVETVAAGMDLPKGEGEEPSFVIAFKAGRMLHFLGKLMVGEETTGDSGERIYRFGSTYAVQNGEDYAVKPSEPLPDMPPGRIRAVIYPSRIMYRLGLQLDREALWWIDATRVPWPMTRLGIGSDIEDDRVSLVGDGEFQPGRPGRRTRAVLAESPATPLAAEYYDPDSTILAASWISPDGADVETVLGFEVYPDDQFLRMRFASEVGRLRREVLPKISGKRAALLIYHQENRIAPGYPGVVIVQELKPGHDFKNDLRLLVNAVSKGIADERTPPPSEYPYFERRPAEGPVPEYYAYYSDMVRRNEGYQPTLALAGDRLIYASSPAALKRLFEVPGLKGIEPAHSWLRYAARGEEAIQQLDNMYHFFQDEMLAARRKEDELEDATDYDAAFEKFKKALELVEEVDLRLTMQKTGDFAIRATIVPAKGEK